MKITLQQEKLNKMLLDFYMITHVRTVIYDGDFNRIAAYPQESCGFCSLMKSNPVSKALCRDNDIQACKICKEHDSLYVYKCHSGLIEAVAPIKMNDLSLGYIMFGQVLHCETNKKEIFSYAQAFFTDEALLYSNVDDLIIMSDQQISAIANIMEACASYLWIAELIKIDNGAKIYLLSDYINNNICGDLSVDTLCSVLNVSRCRLYDIAHKYYGASIAKYIRSKRISIAAKHLRENDCLVLEAAQLAGFTDFNYFSKIFKAEYGETATAYKKRYWNKDAERT